MEHTEGKKPLEGTAIVRPEEIERRSMALIREELGDRTFPPDREGIIFRVIHTTADFEFADILRFSPRAVPSALEAIRGGADIITDTNMAKAGIRARTLKSFGGSVFCFMAEEEIARRAQEQGITRACASMEHAAEMEKKTGRRQIIAIGNAPTALIRLHELIRGDRIHPYLVIGAPVGFVNVTASKRLFLDDPEQKVPYIIPEGRKGGSTVAAAIVNALLIMAETKEQDGKN